MQLISPIPHLTTSTQTPSSPSPSIAPRMGLPAVPLGSPSSLLRAVPATLKAQQLCEAVGSEASAMWPSACSRTFIIDSYDNC
jgi:hypothetical protein